MIQSLPIAPSIQQPTKFVSLVLHSRSQAHIFHLQTTSFAEHKALEDYYTDIVDLFDKLVETWQGGNTIIKKYDGMCAISTDNCVTYFKVLKGQLEALRYTEFKKENTYIQNIIDEIFELIDQTLYKLINLH